MTTWSYIATQADISPISGSGESSRVTLRGDHPGDPGTVWGAFRFSYEAWVFEGDGTWSITLRGSSFPDWFFQDITAASWVTLDKVGSVADCKSKPGSHYSPGYQSGDRLYIHCSDSGDPTGRIYGPRFGYHFRVDNQRYLTFLNLKMYCPPRFIEIFDGQYADHISWEGCTLSYGEHSLLPFGDNCHYMEVIDCDLSWTGNGIYTISETNSSPSYYLFKGNRIHHIGVRPTTQNGDAHAIGIQGGTGGTIEDNVCYKAGSGVTLYAFTNQVLRNTTVRRNKIYDTHTLGGANSIGIETSCDNDSLSDKSGNLFYQNIIFNADRGLKLQFEDTQEVYNNIIYNCQEGVFAARSYNGYGPSIKARNNIICNSGSYHIYYGTSGATASIDSDHNLFYPDGPAKFWFNNTTTSFSGWQSLTKAGFTLDPNSKAADPLFIAASNSNFHLQDDSPGIDAGISVGLTKDIDGVSIPQGFAPDIGPYEKKKTIYLKATASPLSGGPPLKVSFNGDAMGEHPPFDYSWKFGDGGSSSVQNPTHVYDTHGNYEATLTVTDSSDNQERKSITITVLIMRQLSLSTVTGAPSPGEGGTTSPAPGIHEYGNGSLVMLSSGPNINYRFSSWEGDLDSADSYDDKLAVTMDRDKSITAGFCARCGDLNGDLSLTPADSQIAFDIFLGKIANPTQCQKENGDVNCDGTKTNPRVTPADAQAIFNTYLESADLPCNCSGGSRAAAAFSRGIGSLSTGLRNEPMVLENEGKSALLVTLDCTLDTSAFGFDLHFPGHLLQFEGIDHFEGFDDLIQIGSFEIRPGVLRIGAYGSGAKDTVFSPRPVLIVLVFKPLSQGNIRGQFSIGQLFDGARNVGIGAGMTDPAAGSDRKFNREPNRKTPKR
jgi:PKD repeat protein